MQRHGRAAPVVYYVDISDAYNEIPVKVRIQNRLMSTNAYELYYAGKTLKSCNNTAVQEINTLDPDVLQDAGAGMVPGISSAGSLSDC